MKIYFDTSSGLIRLVTTDEGAYLAEVTDTVEAFNIDETASNIDLTRSVLRDYRREDVNGLARYHMVDNAGTWELHERDGWVEAPPEE